MGLELVIFDMDGLMFDTEAISYTSWSEVMRGMGMEPSLRLFSRSLGGHEPGIITHYAQHFGREVSISEIDKMFDESFVIFDRIVEKEGIKIKKGLLELLNVLDEKKIKKAIGSSSPERVIHNYFKLTGVGLNRFDTITSGDMVANVKPNPEIFVKTCEKLKVLPENALVLEDSKNGLQAALSAGIKSVLIPDLSVPDEEMKGKAFKVAESLIDVIDIINNW